MVNSVLVLELICSARNDSEKPEMKAVWSFWSKPFRSRGTWAWSSQKHHLLSWVLSVERARLHYPHTTLYTDDAGARMLVEGSGLHFDHVSTDLNGLEDADPGWWALGKIWTYASQKEPFVHIDSDVFLWKPFPEKMVQADILIQNPEHFGRGALFYQPEVLEAAIHGVPDGWMPEEWEWYRSNGAVQQGECCGVFGGKRVDFINHYARQALKLLNHSANQAALRAMGDESEHMVLVEQYLLSACIKYHQQREDSPYRGLTVAYLFSSMDEAFNPDNASRLGFTHLLAGAKRNQHVTEKLERRVKTDYPAQYERCMSYIRQTID
jgi:hypothetical protein